MMNPALTCAVLCSIFSFGYAIMCYECNSAKHAQCADGLLPAFLRNCSEHERGVTHTLCRKIVQHVDFSVNGQLPASRVIRACGWDDTKYKVLPDQAGTHVFLVDVAMPFDENLVKVEAGKKIKYLNLAHGDTDMRQEARGQMQEYGGASGKPEYRDGDATKDRLPHQEGRQSSPHQLISANYGCTSKEQPDQNIATYCRVVTGVYESTTSGQKYQNSRYNNQSTPTFSSPPNSPLVGLVFDPSSSNYGAGVMTVDRNANPERKSQSSWNHSSQEPIGTGAKKKIVKNQDKRNTYNADPRYHERYKDGNKKDRHFNSDSTSSLDFFVEGERMVSELCNIPDSSSKGDSNNQNIQKYSNQEDYKKVSSSEALLNVLDKIIIHDQIPNQIVQLAIEACTDAENIAIAHHNRPCFKNIHSICAKTRSNVQKPDSAVANLHSQGIPWVIKNFIFSFVRILDGWKGVKELLSEKHDTFSRIENKYYSPNIRECFVQWQAVTKEMLTHIYKTFKCLDHGFTMEQKSFTPNYYGSGSGAPRHQNQNKFQSIKPHSNTPRPINVSPQTFNATQPPWIQNQSQNSAIYDGPWPSRSNITYKKCPVVPAPSSHNFYPLSDQNDMESLQKTQYKCDAAIRETKPRQSWTITNVSDFRSIDSMCHIEQRDLYNQLKHKMDAELGKAPGQPVTGSVTCDLQRREMELKAKMIPLSYVEKSLIPNMVTSPEIRGCYVQKNNSCGDTKEENDFFAAWGQMIQKESSEFITHQAHNIQIPSNIVTIPNNISGPVQFIDPDIDEFHEMSKVYMKPGSYKVPIKATEPVSVYVQATTQDLVYDNAITDELSHLKIPCPSVTLAPHPKYNVESWPCLMQKRVENVFGDDPKILSRHGLTCIDIRTNDILTSMTSDRAWEAAKQSAPKLMDFLHEGSNKSNTVRLYNALGLTTGDEYSDFKKQNGLQNGIPPREWHCGSYTNEPVSKEMQSLWTSETSNNDSLLKNNNQTVHTEEIVKLIESEAKYSDKGEFVETSERKSEECKDQRCPNFDQTGNYVRNEGQKKSSGKSKVAVSGMWYHPKKKKPLQSHIVKKFESVIDNLLQMNEAEFIQQDMDIKTAPRFYEVVKYPMCIHDISTKLKNSSYTEYEQVVQDFRCIFNNVRLYLKHYPDQIMKKNINKVSTDFEKILAEEFQIKYKNPSGVEQFNANKKGEKGIDDNITENSKNVEQIKKNDHRNNSSECKK